MNCTKKILATILFALLLSCEKDANSGIREIKYEVTLINGKTWYGGYVDETGTFIPVQLQPTNWTYKFKDVNKLTHAGIGAYPDFVPNSVYNEDVIMKLFIDGKLYAEASYQKGSIINVMLP